MARASLITDDERMVIRVGVAKGLSLSAIGRYLGRTPAGVHGQVQKMTANGTLGDLPFPFLADDIARGISRHER